MKNAFGTSRNFNKEEAEKTRIIPFVISTNQRDRHHTRLNQSNWDLTNYRLNPVVGYQHNLYGDICNPPNPDDVIGSGDPIVESISGATVLSSNIFFEPADLNPLAEKIFRKCLARTLRATSVGFLPIGEGNWGEKNLNEHQGGTNETYYYAGQELLEFSVVNIPSNPGAVAKNIRGQTARVLSYLHRATGLNFSKIESMNVADVIEMLSVKELPIMEPELIQELSQTSVEDMLEQAENILAKTEPDIVEEKIAEAPVETADIASVIDTETVSRLFREAIRDGLNTKGKNL